MQECPCGPPQPRPKAEAWSSGLCESGTPRSQLFEGEQEEEEEQEEGLMDGSPPLRYNPVTHPDGKTNSGLCFLQKLPTAAGPPWKKLHSLLSPGAFFFPL